MGRRTELHWHQAQVTRLATKHQRAIAREIRRAMREAGKNYADGQIMPVQAVLGAHQKRMQATLEKAWRESASVIAGHTILQIQRAQRRQAKKDTLPRADMLIEIMTTWVVNFGLHRITQITAKTQTDIEDIILQGVEEGLGERDIARLIFAVAPTKSASRSQTIARTEIHGAANWAAQQSALVISEETGIRFMREWAGNQDRESQGGRSRDDHADADGQRVGMYEPFIVGGHRMMQPGDSSLGAPAHQTINCRCAVLMIPII